MASIAFPTVIPDPSRMQAVYTENLPVPSRAVSYPAEEELTRTDRIESQNNFPVPQTSERGLEVRTTIIPELFIDETDLSRDFLSLPSQFTSHFAQDAAASYTKSSLPFLPEEQLIDTYI